MNNNLMTLIKNIIYNRGRDINYLIEKNIVNIDDITNAVIDSGDLEYIYNFAYYIKGADIPKLENVIMKLGTAENIYYFAKYIKGANITKLENAIINTNDAQNIYYFAAEINGANILKLEDAIINTNDAEYIYYFARDVKGTNISKLEDAIIVLGDVQYIRLIREYIERRKSKEYLFYLLRFAHNNDNKAIEKNKEEISDLFKENNKSKTKVLIKDEKIDKK